MVVSSGLVCLPLLVLLYSACTMASPLPDLVEDEPTELVNRIESECKSLTDENQMYHCITRERKRYEIKKELTSMLAVRPLARRNFTIPPNQLKQMLMKEGFAEDGSFEESDERKVDSTRVLPVVQDPAFLPTDKYRSWFSVTGFKAADLKDAMLNFYVKGIIPREQFVRYNVHIYRFRTKDQVDVDPIWSYKRKRVMDITGDWDNVDVTDLVQEWTEDPESNFGLMVKVEPEENGYDDTFDAIDRGNQTAMFLELKMNSENSRSRRSVSPVAGANNTCAFEPSDPESYCCRYQLQVNFTDFGWDWIIAPKRYNAYYCAGKCQQGQHHKNSQHAFIMEHRNPHSMCCSPEKLSEMKIIYMDEATGTLQIRMISNMIVQKCGCS